MTCLRCGSGEVCDCLVSPADLIAISDDGSEADPFIIALTCEAAQDCVGGMFACLGLTYNDGTAKVTADGAIGEALTALGGGCSEWST